jgi:hypothetical protein
MDYIATSPFNAMIEFSDDTRLRAGFMNCAENSTLLSKRAAPF